MRCQIIKIEVNTMSNFLKTFARDEDGAVTVDWVVLTAAICALAIAAIVSINGATGSVGTAVMNFLNGQTVG
jgi:Flp pilus assembly pilin Flp